MDGLLLWDVYAAAALAGMGTSGFASQSNKSTDASNVAANTADKMLALRGERRLEALGDPVAPSPVADAEAAARIIGAALEEIAAAPSAGDDGAFAIANALTDLTDAVRNR